MNLFEKTMYKSSREAYDWFQLFIPPIFSIIYELLAMNLKAHNELLTRMFSSRNDSEQLPYNWQLGIVRTLGRNTINYLFKDDVSRVYGYAIIMVRWQVKPLEQHIPQANQQRHKSIHLITYEKPFFLKFCRVNSKQYKSQYIIRFSHCSAFVRT